VSQSESLLLRVGILSRSVQQREYLRNLLEGNGLQVLPDGVLSENMPNLSGAIADVLLVNLDERDGKNGNEVQDDFSLDTLVEHVEPPILFNESASIVNGNSAAARAWGRRLSEKLIELVQVQGPDTLPEICDVEILKSSLQRIPVDADTSVGYGDNAGIAVVPACGMPIRVIALGASIGGPESVKRFLSVIPEDFPATFVLAQHIGAGFVPLLAEQLGRACRLDVRPATAGMKLQAGQLLVAPVGYRMSFDAEGAVLLEDADSTDIYSPSIDSLMVEVARSFRDKVCAIIFSGMGNDGMRGCLEIAGMGGTIWAQSGDTCVISSMSDAVQETGIVDYRGTPEQLGEYLVQHIESVQT
jgi:hypothetical protein